MLPQLQHKALIIEDIQNAVAAGKVVTISQKAITQNGWTGVGYSIIDLSTGAGAYLIGGGADGGFLSDEAAIMLAILGMVVGAFGFVGFILSIALALIVYMDLRLDLMALEDCGGKDAISGFLNGLALFSIVASIGAFMFATPIAGAAVAIILTWVNVIAGLILINMVTPLSCQLQRRNQNA